MHKEYYRRLAQRSGIEVSFFEKEVQYNQRIRQLLRHFFAVLILFAEIGPV